MGGWEATERISFFSLTRLFPEEYPVWWYSPVSLALRLRQEDCSRRWVQGWSMFHSQTSSQRFKFSKTSFYKATDCSVLREEATHFSCLLQLWLTVRCGQGFKTKTKKAPSLVSQTVHEDLRRGQAHITSDVLSGAHDTNHSAHWNKAEGLSAERCRRRGGYKNSHIYILTVCSRLKQFDKRFWGANSVLSC